MLSLLNGSVELDSAFVLSNAYPEHGDVIVVAGSLIEGIGNAYSDVDVYVLTKRHRRSQDIDLRRHHRVISTDRSIIRPGITDVPVYLIHSVIPGTEIKIDIEYRTFDDLAAIRRTLLEVYDYAVRNLVLLTKAMPERDVTLLHRMFTGVPILNEQTFASVMTELDRQRLCYLLYRWSASDFSNILDIMGAWEAGETERCVDLARENLVVQMKGYVHLLGHTNTRRKWLVSALGRLPHEDTELRDEFLRAFTMNGCDNADGRRSYVLRTLDICDQIHRRCGAALAANPEFPSAREALRLLESDAGTADHSSRYARMEYAYRSLVYGAPSPATRSYLLAPERFD